MKYSFKNILIARTDRIGDVVLTLPLAGLIKKHYPECKVSFLVRDYTKVILNDHPFIDEIIILKEENNKVNFLDNLKIISSKKYDACIVVNPTFIISLILFLSRIETRIGTGFRWYSFLFNTKVYTHRKYAEKHELEFNIELLQKIGIVEAVNENNVKYNLNVEDESLKKIDDKLRNEKINFDNPLIIIHPGSSGSSIDLPVHKFIDLVKKINEDNYQIVITGNEKEKLICNQLVVSDGIINLAGKLNLAELIALISRCDLFISNSTGPIHIAAALGKFTVGFYPKILSCSKERWAPFTNSRLIYTPEIECENCTREQCEKLNCMESIDLNKVYSDIKKVLVQL